MSAHLLLSSDAGLAINSQHTLHIHASTGTHVKVHVHCKCNANTNLCSVASGRSLSKAQARSLDYWNVISLSMERDHVSNFSWPCSSLLPCRQRDHRGGTGPAKMAAGEPAAVGIQSRSAIYGTSYS